ncbi:hypothetical protein D3C87_1524360 [compost metagenome]
MAGLLSGGSSPVRIVGYRDGAQFAYAHNQQAIDAFASGGVITINLANNPMFQGIDAFRVEADNASIIGIDNINARNFQ